MTIPVWDLAEAWQELDRFRRQGWYPSMCWDTDRGWWWTATRPTGRRFGVTVDAHDRDPVVALVRLCQRMEAAE